ncbi:MAG: hypothetical protein CEN88_402 [Candidatus Berkelbacteria bacterium Licking1014_2]|uniref:Peptidase S26 domain-containing protein n=1 Tax=Candidatus Berkelbacteria bacterium Licking1014_2 TaxID=2017146 RepID=A0A554LTR1_9BACT|nr:MAG: hypothetical protein CEN88_402 [Candidatus Berkelbacteria bacterium Licking1014_2]
MKETVFPEQVVRTPAAAAGTDVKLAKKYVTPKWVDWLLVVVLVLLPVSYIAGFSVNYGPSMSHLGWFYRTNWGEQPTRVGQIVRFAQPDQLTWRKYLFSSIKRVAEIRKDGYFVEGDNIERSKDSRDWGKVVPPDHVAGVVNWCWSPKRAWRARTERGRFQNELEFIRSPRTREKLGRFWLVTESGHFTVHNETGTEMFKLRGRPVDNQSTDKQITYVSADDGERWWLLSLETGKTSRVKFTPTISMGFNESAVGLAGDVTAYFPKGKKFLLNEVAVMTIKTKVLQFGIYGVTTVVHFQPPLDSQPIVGTTLKVL